MKERRAALGGYLPRRVSNRHKPLPAAPDKTYDQALERVSGY